MAFQKKQTQPIIAPMFPGKKLGVFHQVIGENMPMTPNLAPFFQPLTGLYEPSAIQLAQAAMMAAYGEFSRHLENCRSPIPAFAPIPDDQANG